MIGQYRKEGRWVTCYRCDRCNKVLDSDKMKEVVDPGEQGVTRHFCGNKHALEWLTNKYNLRLF